MKQNKGFTLIELSIVIVIIGLIVAGVVGGQALVNQAKLRNVISDFKKYNVAVNTFKLEYNSIPGDIRNANDYWNGCNSGSTAAQCNGNGDKRIDFGTSDNDREVLRFWQHLGLAGLLKGQFNGVGTWDCPVGSCPRANIKGNPVYWTENHSISYNFRTPAVPLRSLVLFLSKAENEPNWWWGGLTTPDARNIDSKMDDGVANTGNLIGFSHRASTTPGCSAPSLETPGGADYDINFLNDRTTPRCLLLYILQ